MKKKRPALLLVVTAFTVIVCRCGGPFGAEIQPFMVAPNGAVIGSCESLQELTEPAEEGGDPTFTPVWACTVTCPDKSQVKFDLYSQPSAIAVGGQRGFLAQHCSPEAMIDPDATATSTATATATTAPEEQVVVIAPQNILILPPVLDGGVSACDTGLGFINFTLANTAPDLAGKNVTVTLNDSEVNCVITGSQSQLLGCSLPAGITFPATVKVQLDDVEVNNFSFDGADCTHRVPTRDTDEEEPVDPAAPTDPAAPAAPTATPDCVADPYHPFCS
jgi:hypothetical protein